MITWKRRGLDWETTYRSQRVNVHTEIQHNDLWVWQPYGGSASRGFATADEAIADAEIWLEAQPEVEGDDDV